MKQRRFSFFIFDLDGVIFNSKNNMSISWEATRKKFFLKPKFTQYFRYMGLPFDEILKLLNITSNKKIFSYYRKQSIKNINSVKLYSNATKILKILKKKNIKFSIVTSKDRLRSKMLLKKFNISPNSIHCATSNINGKPNPYLINQSLKKNKQKKKNSCYVGDTFVDYQTSKNAKISFIWSKYGYQEKKKPIKNVFKINNLANLTNYIDFEK